MERERSGYRDHDNPGGEERYGVPRRRSPSHGGAWPEDRQAGRWRDPDRDGGAETEARMRQAQADFAPGSGDDHRWEEQLGGYRRDERRIGADRYRREAARYGHEYGPGWYDVGASRNDPRYRGGTTGDSYFADPGWGARASDFRDRPGEFRGRGPAGYRRSDERIREDVNDRLTDDPFLDATGIQVSVKECEVTLDGTVRSRQCKRQAEGLAEAVSGVAHVQNNLRIRAGEQGTGTDTPV